MIFILFIKFLTENDLKLDRKSTRLNSSHSQISYAVFCLKKKNTDHLTLLVAILAGLASLVVGGGNAVVDLELRPHIHQLAPPLETRIARGTAEEHLLRPQ